MTLAQLRWRVVLDHLPAHKLPDQLIPASRQAGQALEAPWPLAFSSTASHCLACQPLPCAR